MGHFFSRHDDADREPVTAQSVLLYEDAAYETKSSSDGISRLVQIEIVDEQKHRRFHRDPPTGKLRLIIETYPPAPPKSSMRFEPHGLDSRDLSTRSLEPFRATLDRLGTTNPKVESFIVLYSSLRTHQERHPSTDEAPLPPMNRWTAQFIVDTSREGTKPLDDDAKRKLLEDLTKPTYRHSVAVMLKRDEKIKELSKAIVDELGVSVHSVRDMVPELTERLLEIMAKASTTVFTSLGPDGERKADDIQTASRFFVHWVAEAKTTKEQAPKDPGSPKPEPPEPELPDISKLSILSNPVSEGSSEAVQAEVASALEAVSNQLINDLDISDITMEAITSAVLAVLKGAAIYDVIHPFSLSHLSSLCARLLCRIRLHVRDPELRVTLLKLTYDALVLGLCVRTPGLVNLWIDANLSKMIDEAGTSVLKNVLSATASDLAAVDLCLLKLTTKHMQEAHMAPNPAIIHRLATLQGKCHMANCRTPIVGPDGHLPQSPDVTWETTMTLQPTAFPDQEVIVLNAEMGAIPTLSSIYALTQYDYSRSVATALARHVQLVHTNEFGPKSYSHRAVDEFEEMMDKMDAFHEAPTFKDFETE